MLSKTVQLKLIQQKGHITFDVVITAFRKRETKKQASKKKRAEKASKLFEDVKEPLGTLRHYAKLADVRHAQRKRLRESRNDRRVRQRTRFLFSENI